jgi:glutamate-1-semialdehyde 2,1-aminomutase
MFQLWFCAEPPADYREANGIVQDSPFFALYRGLRENGVLIQPPQEGLFLLSSAHTDDVIDRTLAVARQVMPDVAAAASRGEVGPMGGLR